MKPRIMEVEYCNIFPHTMDGRLCSYRKENSKGTLKVVPVSDVLELVEELKEEIDKRFMVFEYNRLNKPPYTKLHELLNKKFKPLWDNKIDAKFKPLKDKECGFKEQPK